jgi:hypothetical protein
MPAWFAILTAMCFSSYDPPFNEPLTETLWRLAAPTRHRENLIEFPFDRNYKGKKRFVKGKK